MDYNRITFVCLFLVNLLASCRRYYLLAASESAKQSQPKQRQQQHGRVLCERERMTFSQASRPCVCFFAH